jgi:hypothetical protein
MRSSSPLCVSTTWTAPCERPDAQSSAPSGETWSMSGLPPMGQVSTTLRLEKSITEMLPAMRLLTYSERVSRLSASPVGAQPGREEVDLLERLRVDDGHAVSALVDDVEQVAGGR